MRIPPIIELVALLKIYRNPDVMIFDASNGSNARANYEARHIEGALYVDLNTQLADIKESFVVGGRHPLPEVDTFAQTLTNLGITSEKHIIIYDDKYGANAAARFWWMLRSAGHEKVQVLNGGLNHALVNSFPMSTRVERVKKATLPYRIERWLLPTIEIDEVERIAQNPDYAIVDVRDKARYEGKIEPIDLIAGHIPGATNLPFTSNLDTNGMFLPSDKLKEKFESILGIYKAENTVVHCGSGVTACHTLLAMDYAGLSLPRLYVGSWSEWSRSGKEIGKTR